MRNTKRVLMIAYHFPPLAGSSGIQRTLRFVQHLPVNGWEAVVLTTNTRAYERVSPDLERDVPRGTVIERAFALDTARHLSVRGRYVEAWAQPDRWCTWRRFGIRRGMQMIREHSPDVIWSTYPIPTAHAIAAELRERSGLPWIADFRDPMLQPDYPASERMRQVFQVLESRVVHEADRCVFTTPGAAKLYADRYPSLQSKMAVIENGFDESSFSEDPPDAAGHSVLNDGCTTLLHSGLVYPEERDPTALFAALRSLRDKAPDIAGRIRLRFRAPVHESLVSDLAKARGVQDLVQVLGPVPYRDALMEMKSADGLLVLQSAGCNAQIPAKLYEYFRVGRPIVALTDPAGDTAGALRSVGVASVARLDQESEILQLLERFVLQDRKALTPRRSDALKCSREARATELAALMSNLG